MSVTLHDERYCIYTMTHKAFEKPNDPLFEPLYVGHSNSADLGYPGDDTGEHISKDNPYYSELTGMYWVWRNDQVSDYVGICHYRRYLLDWDTNRVFTAAKIKQILTHYDLIASEKITLPKSYYEGFSGRHHREDIDELGQVIHELYPEYEAVYRQVIGNNQTYFANMMICKKELYDAYCQWLFSICFELQRRIGTRLCTYDDYCKRIFGFFSEMLLYVWCLYHKKKVYEAHVALIGEKAETTEVKQAMQQYLAKKDLAGAKAYLLKQLESRPDVLMEASDVNGELKLYMQLIVTCEYDESFFSEDVESALKRLRGLNDFVIKEHAGTLTESEMTQFKQTGVSTIAKDIARKVMLVEE